MNENEEDDIMTAGQWLFYGGIALLGMTVLLAGFFWLKRPRGVPGSQFHGADTDPGKRKGETAPDDPHTVFEEVDPPDRETPDTVYAGQTMLPDASTELLPDSGGEPFPGDGVFKRSGG